MTREILKILAEEEAEKVGNPKALAGLEALKNSVVFAGKMGWLRRSLPKGSSIAPASSSEALPSRLIPIAFNIEIPRVSEEDYAETRKAVEATGAFIVPIRAVSIKDLLAEDLNRGQRRFNHGWVNASEIMRATVPPEMEVFIIPNVVRINGSNSLFTDEQKTKIAGEAVRFKEKLPAAVRDFVGLHMVDPSTYSQLEDAWMDVGKGLLFPDFFARTDVQTRAGFVARVGRQGPNSARAVVAWHRGRPGNIHVFAVPVGVLPRKLAA